MQTQPHTSQQTTLRTFTVEQVLVDHIELVLSVETRLSMDRSPVIAIESSYSKSSPHTCM